MSEGVSKMSERAKQEVQSKQTSEWYEQMNERVAQYFFLYS